MCHYTEEVLLKEKYCLLAYDAVWSGRNLLSAKTSVNFCQTALRHFPEDSIPHNHCHENLKLDILLIGFSLSYMIEGASGIILV